jgi:FkbM family methyltransferase
MNRYLDFAYFVIKQLPKYIFGTKPYEVIHRGQTFIFHPRSIDPVTYLEVYTDEQYRLSQRLSGGNVVDVGANIGLFTLWAAKHYHAKHIVAVEMDYHNSDCVKAVVLKNKLAKVVTVINQAFYSKSAFVAENNQSTSLNSCHRIDENGIGAIPTITLAQIIALFHGAKIDILKMDIEGSEKHLLTKGNAELLKQYVKAIIIEVHPQFGCTFEEVAQFLTLAGFSVDHKKYLNLMVAGWHGDTIIAINESL